MLRELLQFQRPTRNGVPRERSVCRESKKPGSVSTRPWSTLSSGAGPLWKVWALLKENPGDQVMSGVILIGDGVRLTRGKFCCTSALERFCDRLPPRLKAPQSNRLSKFMLEVSCAVDRNGSTVLRCTTCALVA